MNIPVTRFTVDKAELIRPLGSAAIIRFPGTFTSLSLGLTCLQVYLDLEKRLLVPNPFFSTVLAHGADGTGLEVPLRRACLRPPSSVFPVLEQELHRARTCYQRGAGTATQSRLRGATQFLGPA